MKGWGWLALLLAVTPLAAGEFPHGDLVWIDADGDGLQDAGELGLGGVEVRLYEDATCSSSVSLSTTTAADGSYQLDYGCLPDQLGICTICLEFVLPATADYEFSPANQGGDDTLDSDADASGRVQDLLVGTEPNLTIDAGAVPVPIPVTLTRFTVNGGPGR